MSVIPRLGLRGADMSRASRRLIQRRLAFAALPPDPLTLDVVSADTLTPGRVGGGDPGVARLQFRLGPQAEQHARHHAQELGVERAVEDEVAGVVDGHQHRDDQLERAVAVRGELGRVAAVDERGGRLPAGQVGRELADQKQHDDAHQCGGQPRLLLGVE